MSAYKCAVVVTDRRIRAKRELFRYVLVLLIFSIIDTSTRDVNIIPIFLPAF
jgi:hypothetical protein